MTGNLLKIGDVRLAFTQDLHKARSYKNEENKTKKYRTKLLIAKNHKQLPDIFTEIKRLAVLTWGDQADQVLLSIKGNNQKFGFLDGDLAPWEGFKDHYYLNASRRETDGKPLYLRQNPIVPGTKDTPNIITEQSGELYSGAYVNAHVSFWTWTRSGNSMNVNLLGLQFYRRGEPFTGSAAANVSEFGNEEPDEPTVVGASGFEAFM